MYDLKLFLLAHKCFYQISLETIQKFFKKCDRGYNFRRKLTFEIPFPKTELLRKSICYKAPTLGKFRFIREKISRGLNKMQLQLSRESHKENIKILYFDTFQRTLIETSVSK